LTLTFSSSTTTTTTTVTTTTTQVVGISTQGHAKLTVTAVAECKAFRCSHHNLQRWLVAEDVRASAGPAEFEGLFEKVSLPSLATFYWIFVTGCFALDICHWIFVT
jgi:hypothetical protein